HFFFLLLILRLPRSTLFPYTTLFRSLLFTIQLLTSLPPLPMRTLLPRGTILLMWLCTTKKCMSPLPARMGMMKNTEPDLGTLMRSEEHTSELQSRGHLVCRLLLEKKK